VIVTSCVSNETKANKYPSDVRLEIYRSEPTVANPNALLALSLKTFNGPGFANDMTYTIANASGVTNLFHVRVIAEKSIVRSLLCHAHFTDSTTAPSYATSLPLERRGKLALPKDIQETP
jgi:hypothetical protein